MSGLDFLSEAARREIEALIEATVERKLAERESGAPRPSPWIYGAKEAAAYLGLSERAIFHKIDSIPHRRDGRRLVFRTDELDRWMEEADG